MNGSAHGDFWHKIDLNLVEEEEFVTFVPAEEINNPICYLLFSNSIGELYIQIENNLLLLDQFDLFYTIQDPSTASSGLPWLDPDPEPLIESDTGLGYQIDAQFTKYTVSSSIQLSSGQVTVPNISYNPVTSIYFPPVRDALIDIPTDVASQSGNLPDLTEPIDLSYFIVGSIGAKFFTDRVFGETLYQASGFGVENEFTVESGTIIDTDWEDKNITIDNRITYEVADKPSSAGVREHFFDSSFIGSIINYTIRPWISVIENIVYIGVMYTSGLDLKFAYYTIQNNIISKQEYTYLEQQLEEASFNSLLSDNIIFEENDFRSSLPFTGETLIGVDDYPYNINYPRFTLANSSTKYEVKNDLSSIEIDELLNPVEVVIDVNNEPGLTKTLERDSSSTGSEYFGMKIHGLLVS